MSSEPVFCTSRSTVDIVVFWPFSKWITAQRADTKLLLSPFLQAAERDEPTDLFCE